MQENLAAELKLDADRLSCASGGRCKSQSRLTHRPASTSGHDWVTPFTTPLSQARWTPNKQVLWLSKVRLALHGLPLRQRQVLELRFGLARREPMHQERAVQVVPIVGGQTHRSRAAHVPALQS